ASSRRGSLTFGSQVICDLSIWNETFLSLQPCGLARNETKSAVNVRGIRPWRHLPAVLGIAAADTMVLHRDCRRRPRQRLEYSMAPMLKGKCRNPERRKIPELATRDEIGRRVEWRASQLAEDVVALCFVLLVDLRDVIVGDSNDCFRSFENAHGAAVDDDLTPLFPQNRRTKRLHEHAQVHVRTLDIVDRHGLSYITKRPLAAMAGVTTTSSISSNGMFTVL